MNRENPTSSRGAWCANVILTLIGLILVLAAGAKLAALWTEPLIAGLPVETRAMQLALTAFEGVLGWAICVRFYFSITRVVALVALGMMCAWSVRAVFSSWSCGCFGAIDVPPDVLLAYNTVAITALLVLSCRQGMEWKGRRYPAVAGFLVIGASVLMVGVQSTDKHSLKYRGLRAIGAELVGMEIPYTEILGDKSELDSGVWVVCLWSSTCSHCRTSFEAMCDTMREVKRTTGVNAAFVQMDGAPASARQCMHAEMLRARANLPLFAALPVTIVSLDGTALAVWEEAAPNVREVQEAVGEV